MRRLWMAAIAGFGLAALAVAPAEAKPAQCFTTDDGHYPCNFRGLDKAGSFRISAPGYPTFTIEIESAGVAWAFADYGTRNVALPGPYLRARDDRACWENPDTGSRICAW
ncbi:MAG: hypothetical protein KF914_10110 [Rhizobiaceae bacterium]|nr:hypothetical protein [Rhizobiaceae bacterium]